MKRRFFLSRGSIFAGAAAISGGIQKRLMAETDLEKLPPNIPPWTRTLGAGVATTPYGLPSSFEAHIARRHVPWLTASPISSVAFTPLHELEGIITPNGLFFERHHAGIPLVEPDAHRLIIHGLVERPLILTMTELQRFPSESVIHFLECPANGGMEWRGA